MYPRYLMLLAPTLAFGCTVNVPVGELTESTSMSDSSAADGDATEPALTSDPDDTEPAETSSPATTDDPPGDTSTTSSTGPGPDATTNDPDTTANPTNDPDTTAGPTTDSTGDTSTGDDTTTGAPAGGCEPGWTRARTITITNRPEKPLSNYQVMVKVTYDDDMKPSFEDLRFHDAMGASLPYWIEDYDAPVEALVWVRVPAIAAATDTEITMCYGNPDANDASDGEATFVFFDGFEGNSLDTDKWAATSAPTVSLGSLFLDKGAIYSKVSPGSEPNLHIEVKGKHGLSGTGDYSTSLHVASSQTGLGPSAFNNLNCYGYKAYSEMLEVLSGKFPEGICLSDQSYVLGIAADEANVYTFAKRQFSAVAPLAWKKPIFLGLGYGLKDSGTMDIYDMTVEWVLVRKFTSIPPTTAIGPETMP